MLLVGMDKISPNLVQTPKACDSKNNCIFFIPLEVI